MVGSHIVVYICVLNIHLLTHFTLIAICSVYVCVCMYVRMYVCMCVCVYVCMCVCMCVCMYVCAISYRFRLY